MKYKLVIDGEVSVPEGTTESVLIDAIKDEWNLGVDFDRCVLPLGPKGGYRRVTYGNFEVTVRLA